MNERFQKVFDAITDVFKKEDSKIIKELDYAVNCFGVNSDEFIQALNNDSGKRKNFALIALICCIAMGYTYKREELCSCSPHWDDRNKKSKEYCYQHYDEFVAMFENLSGYKLEFFAPEPKDGFLSNLKNNREGINHELLLIKECSYYLYHSHPTLQQSMMRIFLSFLSEYPDSFIKEVPGLPFI